MSAINIYPLLRRLWGHVEPKRRKQIFLLLILMVFTSIAEVASIGAVLPFLGALMAPERLFDNALMQPIVKAAGFAEPKQLLFPLTAFFILAAVFSGAMRLILLYAQTHLSFAIGADFSAQIYKRTLYQPYLVHVSRNSSQVIAAISVKTNSAIYGILLPLLLLVSSSFILLTLLITLIVIDPLVTLVALSSFGGLYGLIMALTHRRLARDSQRISYESDRAIKLLQEGLGGIRDVLIDGTQSSYCQIYRESDLSIRRSQASLQIMGGAPRFIIESLGMILIAILAYWLALRDVGVAGAIPVLGALALGAQRILPVLQQIYSAWSSLRGNQASLSDVLNLLDQPLPRYASETAPPKSLQFKDSIRLTQVVFRYASDSPCVLQGINLEIKKGSRIGFVGSTGSGKTTLVDLIMGLLEPTNGNISVDGVPITAKNCRSWQMHIAHVPQSIFLADSTIAENIAFGVPPEKINHLQVINAAKQAQIASVIETWIGQYQTFVGERGIRLSGGQRQRIGIARALYKNADVIVFDEATSALDNDTEDAVMKAIDTIDKEITVVMVAHRLSTLKNCDQIIELEQGRIKRKGTYEQIVNSKTKGLVL